MRRSLVRLIPRGAKLLEIRAGHVAKNGDTARKNACATLLVLRLYENCCIHDVQDGSRMNLILRRGAETQHLASLLSGRDRPSQIVGHPSDPLDQLGVTLCRFVLLIHQAVFQAGADMSAE